MPEATQHEAKPQINELRAPHSRRYIKVIGDRILNDQGLCKKCSEPDCRQTMEGGGRERGPLVKYLAKDLSTY